MATKAKRVSDGVIIAIITGSITIFVTIVSLDSNKWERLVNLFRGDPGSQAPRPSVTISPPVIPPIPPDKWSKTHVKRVAQQGQKAFNERRYEDAYSSLAPIAEKSDIAAFLLGVMYKDSLFIRQDFVKAEHLLKKACKADKDGETKMPGACTHLGQLMLNLKKFDQAEKYFLMAGNDPNALIFLEDMKKNGWTMDSPVLK